MLLEKKYQDMLALANAQSDSDSDSSDSESSSSSDNSSSSDESMSQEKKQKSQKKSKKKDKGKSSDKYVSDSEDDADYQQALKMVKKYDTGQIKDDKISRNASMEKSEPKPDKGKESQSSS